MDKKGLVTNSKPGYLYGINTITTSLGQKHRDIDISNLPVPKNYVGPWLQNKIDPDSNYNTNL